MPEMGESVTEGIVLEWHVAEGDFVNEGDTVVEVSTDKVDAEVPAPMDGVITKLSRRSTTRCRSGLRWLRWKPGEGSAEGPGAAAAGPVARGRTAPASCRRERPPRRHPRQRRLERLRVRTEHGNGGRRCPGDARGAEGCRGERRRSCFGQLGPGPGSKVTKEDVLAAADGVAATGLRRGCAARRSSCGGRRRCWPRRWTRAGRCRRRPRSGRSRWTRWTRSGRRSTRCLKERGLKVSFTHLVAWAIVRGDQRLPGDGADLRRSATASRSRSRAARSTSGSPSTSRSKDGSHSLMVPAIKGADGLDFAGFHSYYEELIAKTRENKLTADDFQGTNISLTNPGGIGTVASVPRLLERPERDHRHRLDRLPAGVAARLAGTAEAARRLEGDDADLDLRPPGDPGGRVGRLPAPGRAAAAGRGRVLRGGRRRPRHRRRRRHHRPPRLGLGAAARRRRRRRPAPNRAPPRARSTKSCCRRSRRRPRCSRPTAPTATSPPSSTRSAPSRRATRRCSRRTST